MTDDTIGAVLAATTTIAVVGLSRDPTKAAHLVPLHMQRARYRIIPVHPSATTLLGQPAYGSLAEIPEHVDLVNVFRPSEETADIAREAAAIGADALWLQRGIRSDEARAIAGEAGMEYIEDRCIMVEQHRRGSHPPDAA